MTDAGRGKPAYNAAGNDDAGPSIVVQSVINWRADLQTGCHGRLQPAFVHPFGPFAPVVVKTL